MAPAPRERDITLNGHGFHLHEWGEPGQPVILCLHGFPEYGGAWADLAPHLAGFHLIAPDQRGYGQSWAPQDVGDYAASKLVGDMAALIETLGIAPCTVLGHDWGAAVAYGLAMMKPELVSRLIIINGVHPAPFQRAIAAGGAQTEASQYIHYLRRDGSEDALAENDFEKLLALFSAKMDLSWLSGDRLTAYKQAWSGPERLRGMINWYRASPLRVAKPGEPITDLPELPRERLMVPQPHLLIWGAGDSALLPETTAGLEYYAPDLTRVTIDGADHWVCHQKPETVARTIRDWLGAQNNRN